MEGLGLSAAALAALREFAQEKGVAVDDDEDATNVLSRVQEHFDIKDKNDTFKFSYGKGKKRIAFTVSGVKREIGQTLTSTGLTIWRAAENLGHFIYAHPERFQGRTCCELGAGLGSVSILLQKLRVARAIVCTDGDDETLPLLGRNVQETDSGVGADGVAAVEVRKLFWGEAVQPFLQECQFLLGDAVKTEAEAGEATPAPAAAESANDASLPPPAPAPEPTSAFTPPLRRFDVVLGADIIYELDQVAPLVDTVRQIMAENGEFLLAFARRNVPMDAVIEAAARVGLRCAVLDVGSVEGAQEPVYRFTFTGAEVEVAEEAEASSSAAAVA